MDFGERSTEGKIYWVPKAEQLRIKRALTEETTASTEETASGEHAETEEHASEEGHDTLKQDVTLFLFLCLFVG